MLSCKLLYTGFSIPIPLPDHVPTPYLLDRGGSTYYKLCLSNLSSDQPALPWEQFLQSGNFVAVQTMQAPLVPGEVGGISERHKGEVLRSPSIQGGPGWSDWLAVSGSGLIVQMDMMLPGKRDWTLTSHAPPSGCCHQLMLAITKDDRFQRAAAFTGLLPPLRLLLIKP